MEQSEYKRWWYNQNKEKILAKRKSYYESNKVSVNFRNKIWQQQNRERSREIKRAWYRRKYRGDKKTSIPFPPELSKSNSWIKKKAVEFIGGLIKRGILVRPKKCSQCDKTKNIEAHHHRGYKKHCWLDIIWVCRTCHDLAHHP